MAVITRKQILFEARLILACSGTAYALIIFSVIKNTLPASELFKKLPLAIVTAILFYAVLFIVRILYKILTRKKKK